MTLDQLKAAADDAARALQQEKGESVPPDLRKRLIEVRGELFRRGIVDPVLIRLDSATVARAPLQQIADHLKAIAESLTV